MNRRNSFIHSISTSILIEKEIQNIDCMYMDVNSWVVINMVVFLQ